MGRCINISLRVIRKVGSLQAEVTWFRIDVWQCRAQWSGRRGSSEGGSALTWWTRSWSGGCWWWGSGWGVGPAWPTSSTRSTPSAFSPSAISVHHPHPHLFFPCPPLPRHHILATLTMPPIRPLFPRLLLHLPSSFTIATITTTTTAGGELVLLLVSSSEKLYPVSRQNAASVSWRQMYDNMRGFWWAALCGR